MTKLLDIALRQLDGLTEPQQDEIAAYILEELEMREDVAAYDEAKRNPSEAVPLEEALAEIEAERARSEAAS